MREATTENDDDPPDNVIPFGHVAPWVIGDALRRHYQALLSEKLPDNLSALAERLAAKLAKAKESV